MFKITGQTPDGEVVGTARHGWDVVAKLRNAMDCGYTDFRLQPITPDEAKQIDPGHR